MGIRAGQLAGRKNVPGLPPEGQLALLRGQPWSVSIVIP